MGEALDHLLRWLAPDEERAGERYEMCRRKLIQFFEHEGCSFPEELADQTLDRVARRLAEGEVILTENPLVYCLGVARNVAREYWRSPERRKTAPLESLSPREIFESSATLEQAKKNELEQARRMECLTQCLQRLSPEESGLIKEYYHDDKRAEIDNRKKMAEQLGLSPVGLRARAHRIRQKLEQWVKACVKRG